MYVSDGLKQSLTCLDRDWGVVYNTTDSQLLKYPRQILLDREDNVFVSDGDTHTLLVVSPDGKIHTTLLTEEGWVV